MLEGFEVFRALGDSTNIRSYAFVAIGQPLTGNPDFYGTLYQHGSLWYASGLDVNLSIFPKDQLVYYYGNSSSGQGNPSTPTHFTPPNPNHPPTSGHNFKIFYWVQAKYANGGVSPLEGPLSVTIN